MTMQISILYLRLVSFSVFTWGLIGLLGLSGCASMRSTPDWVNGEPPPEYPKHEFVTGLGTGESFASAQDAAKSELSRVFSAKLKSEIELIDRESVVDDRATQSSDLLTNTRISTEIELQGVEVPLHWRDPRSGETWALAVLERRKECLRIRTEGDDLITRLAALAAGPPPQSNPLVAVRTGVNALKVGVELDGLQARSRVLGSQCLTPRPISTGALRARVDSRLRDLSFVVTTQEIDPRTGKSNGPLPQLRERIAGNLTKMGFTVGPATGARVVPVDARLRLRRVERGSDWVEYRWEGSAEIGSPDPGDPVIIVAESEGAESHPENSTARLRARRKGEQDLSRRLDTLLKAFLAEDESE
jgi:hypothetical protein